MRHVALTAIAVGAWLGLAGSGWAEGGSKPATSTLTGEVVSVQSQKLTVGVRKEGKVVREETFTLTADSKIVVETDEDAGGGGGEGEGRKQPKTKPGTVDDVKAGQRVTVTYDDAKAALEVIVRRPPPVKTGGEG